MAAGSPDRFFPSSAQRNRWLTLLHRYNGWNVVFLLVTGLVLYFPQLRGVTAPVRVPLKYAHIAAGVAMALLLAAYLPLLPGHVQRLNHRFGQKLNVALLMGITAGWTGTGVVLWLHRSFPPEWASAALLWHDYLTWVILPWMVIHSATRYLKWRVTLPGWVTGRPPIPVPGVDVERRAALHGVAAVAAGVVWTAAGWPVLRGVGGLGDGTGTQPSGTFSLPFADPPHPLLRLPGAATVEGQPGLTASAQLSPPAFAGGTGPPPFTRDQPPRPVPMRTPITGGGRRGSFRIYTVTDGFPAFRPDLWRFQAGGLVDRPLDMAWEDFLRLPRVEQVSDFHCVTGWSVYRITWEGVRLSHLLDYLGVKPEADHVKFYSGDGEYTDDLPLTVAMSDDVMLAYVIDGQPLPTELGGPVRLIVPKMYAYKSVKWTQGIELIRGPHEGYWEERGYPRDAWVKR